MLSLTLKKIDSDDFSTNNFDPLRERVPGAINIYHNNNEVSIFI